MKYFNSTTESRTTFSRNNSYIIKLERYMKDLLQYDCMLNSYICEPQTRALFEQKDALKFQLVNLQNTNCEIIDAIRNNKENAMLQIERINSQMAMLDQLQVDLKSYSTSIIDHSKLVS